MRVCFDRGTCRHVTNTVAGHHGTGHHTTAQQEMPSALALLTWSAACVWLCAGYGELLCSRLCGGS
jgi:hypothetical protein